MAESEREALEQLNQYWDALLAAGDADVGELDPSLANSIRMLHVLDDTPAPDRAYARRLEQRLNATLLRQKPRWSLVAGSTLRGLMPVPALAVALTLLLAVITYLTFNALPRTPVPAISVTAPSGTPVSASPTSLASATPAAIPALGAWRPYTNTAGAYAISYPADWFLQPDERAGIVFITSFQLLPAGGGGIPPGSVKIDIYNASPAPDLKDAHPFCVADECGVRIDQRAPFTEPAAAGLDRSIIIRIPKGDRAFQLSALIAEPASAAERNAAIVEQIIASLRFVRTPIASPRPEAQRQAAIASVRTCLGKPDAPVEYKSTARSTYFYDRTSEFYFSGGDSIEVDTRTNQVVQIGPAPLSAGATPKPIDQTPRYTPEQLAAMARAFIARCARVDLDKLAYNQGDKGGGPNYFFRWEDKSPPKPVDGYPFIQVGFSRGGDFLSYANTLGLAPGAR